MDERIEKEEINLYTPEMAGWGDDESIKEKNQMEWLKGRVKEISTWSGASLVALGLLVVLGGPLVKLAAYAAIAYGVSYQ